MPYSSSTDTGVEEDGCGRDWRHQTYIGTFLRHAVLCACKVGDEALAVAPQGGMFQKMQFQMTKPRAVHISKALIDSRANKGTKIAATARGIILELCCLVQPEQV